MVNVEGGYVVIRIATWNVNSVRLRRLSIRRFVRLYSPDVLCLQETKVVDGSFPTDWFRQLGFENVVVHGQKSYNGVAIASKLPFERTRTRQWCGRLDHRHIYVVLPGGIELHNVYVPAGGDIPDPARNPKFAHKLQFLKDMTAWFRRRRASCDRCVLVGDLNVAPLENDVWSHEKLKRVVTHTPAEVEAMERLRQSLAWVDAVRYFVPESERLYSWWSYRARNWRVLDKGRRLDHIWVSPALAGRLKGYTIVKAARGWRLPSDHAPVMITLELPDPERFS
jgi:exodeoxyribonuclease-3